MNTTYQETLERLYQLLPMYQRIGAPAFKKDLSNTFRLDDVLGQPSKQFKSIHIAGTNGKGSTAHMLSAILQAHGLKVGLYTSPHYIDFRERIKINGTYIPKAAVIQLATELDPAIQQIQPSFFEVTVVMAFAYFAKEKVDVAVIETGLGGEFDSTNIIQPILSIITNISYDHQHILGNTLAEIAVAKAGIIKKGIPAVIGESHPETREVFLQKGKTESAPLYFADQTLRVNPTKQTNTHTYYNVLRDQVTAYTDLKVNLLGEFQAQNLQTVLQSTKLLSPYFPLTEVDIRCGLAILKSTTKFFGRWDILQHSPLVIVDSAHNRTGVTKALKQITSLHFNQLRIVLGMVTDKAHEELLALFPNSAIYYFTKANIPRGLNAETLQKKAADCGLKGNTYTSVSEAYRMALKESTPDDCIFIGGSVFVAAEVYVLVQPENGG